MLVTYPDVCWCQLISPSITGLRHYRSGCALLLGARSAHEHHDEAHDPRQSWSDTSPPISQAVPGLQSGSDDTHFVLPSSRQTKTGTKLSLHAQNSPNSRLLDEQGDFVTDNAPKAPRPGTFCPTTSCMLTRSTTGSHVHRLLHGWAGATHGASEAWLRCPRAVAGPGSQDAEPDCRTHLIIPRGVTFVPGTAWPARPLDARAASCARRVVSKPGQALQTLRRPPQGRRLLSTLSWPCMPANSAYVQTRPRPVSRPRPRQ